MTTLYVLPEPDHYCIADDTWSFTRALVAAEIEKAYRRGVSASIKAVYDAGGDNADYHIDAIGGLK
jgi:hypothetical protein